MTKKLKPTDRNRVLAFRRILREKSKKEGDLLSILEKQSDENLLNILNAAILPNSLSPRVLRFSYLSCLIFARSNVERLKLERSLAKIRELADTMTPLEKNLYKFGILRGITSGSWQEIFRNFVQNPVDPDERKLDSFKKVSSFTFKNILPFIRSILKKGENGEQFPRL